MSSVYQTRDGILDKYRMLLFTFFILSILSFLTTLQLPYLGEEAVYTISSLEMWYHKEWFTPILYGAGYGRPPLFNWCIILLAKVLHWENVLLASRLVTSLATLVSTLMLFALTQILFKNKTRSLFIVCIYLSGDLLLRRGWLAYADPLFAMGIFIAIASAWIALEKKQKAWFVLVSLGLIISYLSKALTGFVFYGISFLVLARLHPNRRLLISPFSILMHLGSLFFIFIWNKNFSQGIHNQSMMSDILRRIALPDFSSYVLKIMTYPFDTFIRCFPYGALLLYFAIMLYWRERSKQATSNICQTECHNASVPTSSYLSNFFSFSSLSSFSSASSCSRRSIFPISLHNSIRILFWILILNYIPYWFSPFARIRYLLPLYPFFAIFVAYMFIHWEEKIKCIKTTLLWMGGCLILKYAMALVIDPYYEKQYRGDYQATAQKILDEVGNFPLYTNNVSATGLSVTAYLDILRLPKAPLSHPPEEWPQGFFLSNVNDYPNTQISRIFVLGSRKMYLLCRGKACELK